MYANNNSRSKSFEITKLLLKFCQTVIKFVLEIPIIRNSIFWWSQERMNATQSHSYSHLTLTQKERKTIRAEHVHLTFYRNSNHLSHDYIQMIAGTRPDRTSKEEVGVERGKKEIACAFVSSSCLSAEFGSVRFNVVCVHWRSLRNVSIWISLSMTNADWNIALITVRPAFKPQFK